MTKIAAIPISSFGMTCEKCGDTLITPEWSEYVSEHEVVNIWSCTTCGFQFETATNMPADSESEIDSNVLRYFFPLLLVA
jgi:ribosomal protein L37AE/L43A